MSFLVPNKDRLTFMAERVCAVSTKSPPRSREALSTSLAQRRWRNRSLTSTLSKKKNMFPGRHALCATYLYQYLSQSACRSGTCPETPGDQGSLHWQQLPQSMPSANGTLLFLLRDAGESTVQWRAREDDRDRRAARPTSRTIHIVEQKSHTNAACRSEAPEGKTIYVHARRCRGPWRHAAPQQTPTPHVPP